MSTHYPAAADQRFFVSAAQILAAVIIFGFVQFSARGFVQFAAVPWWVHGHGLVMLSWLALLVTQSRLALHGNLALHRKLGWLGLVIAGLAIGFASYSGYRAVELGRVPPFFTDAHFLALSVMDSVCFAALVCWAIVQRRRTDWHRRLMIGATIILLEPALGRLLPMPLLGAWGSVVQLAIQLGVLAIMARHDRRTYTAVHPATLACGAVLIAEYATVWLLAHFPPLIAFAQALSGR